MLKHIPNMLTILRFILIPFIVVLILKEKFLDAFILLTISSLSDVLDGRIARKFNLVTDIGKLLDPLADKANQISVLVSLVIIKVIPIWIVVILFIKEFILIAGASWLYGKKVVVSSKWYGKMTTVIFYLAIVSSFFIRIFNFKVQFDIYLYYIGVALAIFSLIMYFKDFYQDGYVKEIKDDNNVKQHDKEIKEDNKEKQQDIKDDNKVKQQ